MSLEDRIADATGICDCRIEIADDLRDEIHAVVEAAEVFDSVDYRVSSDGTFIYRLGVGIDLSDDNKLILSF